MKKISCSILSVFAILLLAPFKTVAGDQTIPLDPTTDQSVIEEAIFLVDQYGGLAENIDEWLSSDTLGELTGPTFGHLGYAIATYTYAKEISDALDCGEPGKPACDDTAARWMNIADKVGSLALEWAVDKAVDTGTNYVLDTLLWQGASSTVGLVTTPGKMCYQAVKSVIDTVDGNNIRNRIVFYIQFKEKFPCDADPLPLQRVMNEHEDPRNIPGFTAEQQIFVLSFFTGYLTGRIVNESIDMVRNCQEPAKNLWEMKENARILVSGFDPEAAGKKLADEIVHMDQARKEYVEEMGSPKIKIIRSGNSLTVQNIGNETLMNVYIRETNLINSQTGIAPLIQPNSFHTFDLTPLGNDPPEKIVFDLFGISYSRPLSELGFQDVLPVIQITGISNNGVIPVTIQVNAGQTLVAQGLTPAYSWKISKGADIFQTTGSEISYTCEEGGVYNISLTVSAGGNDYSAIQEFTAKTDYAMKPVIESLTVSNERPDKGDMIHLEVNANDPYGMGLEYKWTETEHFSGESKEIGTARAVDVVFDGGYKDYEVEVRNPHGADRDDVSVMEAGEWNIRASGADWIGDATLTFTAVGGNPAGATFQWLFSDGGSGSGESVSHYFAGSGDYTATLKVNKNGSVTEVTKAIRLINETEIPWQVGEPDSANITAKGANYLTVSLQPPAGSYSQVLVVARAAGEPAWSPQNGQTYTATGWMGDGKDRLAGIGTSMTSIQAGGLDKVGARWYVRVWYRYYENSTYKYRMEEGGAGVTALGGTITENLTLDASGSPYVLSEDLIVTTGVTLTIQSGVIIKAKPSYPSCRIIVQGELNASGVVFTSVYDDGVGGDTNGDGSSTIPSVNNWRGIVFESGSKGNLDGVRLSYGDEPLNGAAYPYYPYGGQITIMGTDNVSVSNSVIRNGGGDGIYIKDASPEIRNCIVSDNYFVSGPNVYGGHGIYLANSSATVTGNEVTGNKDAGIYLSNSNDASVINNKVFGNANNSYWYYKGIYAYRSINSIAGGNDESEMICLNEGTLTLNSNWSKKPLWIISGDIIIGVDADLTIEPGTIIKSIVQNNNNAKITVQGELNATGVVFTSSCDDGAGGDTNGDGSSTIPSVNNWRGIVFESGSKGNLDGVRMSYGGEPLNGASYPYYAYGGQIMIMGTDNVSVSNSVIRNGGGDGIYIKDASPEIRNCIVSDHYFVIGSNAYGGNGICLSNSSATVTGNEVTENKDAGICLYNSKNSLIMNNKAFENNANNTSYWYYTGIYATNSANSQFISNKGTDLIYLSGGSINSPRTWDNKQPWVLDSTLTITPAGKLTISTGTVVKCKSSSIYVEGTLNASNAFFTSYKDDIIGGDTNADTNLTTPAPGDWKAIVYKTGSKGILDNVTVRYGSDAYFDSKTYSGQVVILSGNITVKNSLLQYSSKAGLYVEGAAPALISNRLFNNYYGLYTKNTALPVHDNSFAGNSSYGLYNASSAYTVDATNNFWGHPTGPQHTGNPGGLGDKVSNYVIFASWQNSEYSLADAIILLQLLTGIQTDYIPIGDINGDSRIGLPEILYILQILADNR